MNPNDARSEIVRLLDAAEAIERKHPDGIDNNEDLNEYKRLLGEVDSLEAKLSALHEASAVRERMEAKRAAHRAPVTAHVQPSAEMSAPAWKSLGEAFTTSAGYREAKESGALDASHGRVSLLVPLQGVSLLSLAKKALIYSATGVGGALVQNDVRPGVVNELQRELTLLDLIPTSRTTSDTIEYVTETWTNAAAAVAEASSSLGTSGRKPEGAVTWATQTAPVRTLAHWVPITTRMLADAPAVESIINARLLLGLSLALEAQIATGDGNSPNMEGLLQNSSVGVQGKGSDSDIDAIFKAVTKVRVSGNARPQAIVMHPNDYAAIRLARENVSTATLGAYLMGPPSLSGPVTLWGLPVVQSQAITENTALVGDFSNVMLFEREGAMISTGTIDDQLVRNMRTILAEVRAAFAIMRPTAFCKVTGI